jgi:hypothetical protein
MSRTIIAGCNGRERGRGAVSLAHAISSATGARHVLVGVHHHCRAACAVLVPPRRSDAEHADALLGALLVAAR